MVPDVGASNPAIKLSKVDFPQPEGPKNTTNSPSLTSRVTGRSASTFWVVLANVLATSCNLSSTVIFNGSTSSFFNRRQPFLLENFLQYAQLINPGQVGRLPEKPNLAPCLGAFEKRGGDRVPGKFHSRHGPGNHRFGQRFAGFLFQLGVQCFDRCGRVSL